MPFPTSERVIYQKNPLEVVITQLRFPPILRIETEPPAAFQELIRGQYPMFRETRVPVFDRDLPPQVARVIGPIAGGTARAHYEFSSSDGKWSVTLNRDFLALTCRNYGRWEEFKEHLAGPFHGLNQEYHPGCFTRIGLRYRDVIRRSKLGLTNVNWSDLLQPHVSGELSSADVASDIEHAVRELRVKLEDSPRKVLIKHGLHRAEDSGEDAFVIDSDYFVEEQTEIENAIAILDDFNRQAGRLFRWCITDRLHGAMEPKCAK